MMTGRDAARYVAPTSNLETVLFKNGGVDDIVDVILYADKLSKSFTKDLAPQLKGASDMETLRNLFYVVNNNIRYVRDRVGNEVVKSPGKFWKDRKGDCKSYSIFIGSVLKNLGYKYKYRVAFYDPKEPEKGHIYPIVVLPGGKQVVMDAIPLNDYTRHRAFNQEVPYWKAYDYAPSRSATTALAGFEDAEPTKSRLQKILDSFKTDEFWVGVAQRTAQGVIVWIGVEILKTLVEKRRTRRRTA